MPSNQTYSDYVAQTVATGSKPLPLSKWKEKGQPNITVRTVPDIGNKTLTVRPDPVKMFTTGLVNDAIEGKPIPPTTERLHFTRKVSKELLLGDLEELMINQNELADSDPEKEEDFDDKENTEELSIPSVVNAEESKKAVPSILDKINDTLFHKDKVLIDKFLQVRSEEALTIFTNLLKLGVRFEDVVLKKSIFGWMVSVKWEGKWIALSSNYNDPYYSVNEAIDSKILADLIVKDLPENNTTIIAPLSIDIENKINGTVSKVEEIIQKLKKKKNPLGTQKGKQELVKEDSLPEKTAAEIAMEAAIEKKVQELEKFQKEAGDRKDWKECERLDEEIAAYSLKLKVPEMEEEEINISPTVYKVLDKLNSKIAFIEKMRSMVGKKALATRAFHAKNKEEDTVYGTYLGETITNTKGTFHAIQPDIGRNPVAVKTDSIVFDEEGETPDVTEKLTIQ